MRRKIFAGLLGVMSLVLTLNSAAASQIPAGYVLVPAEAFFGQDVNFATPTATAGISTTKSSLRVSDEIGYIGGDPALATATLRDETGKPVAGKSVSLVSSRGTDAVKSLQAVTNSNGEAIFQIIANEEGVSTFTAVADSQTIAERPRMVFLKTAGGIGGNLLGVDLLEGDALSESAIAAEHYVEITFPSKVVVNVPTDITVEIQDVGGITVDDFGGEISFASSDGLAILPLDYTFTELDRGVHTFANAVSFSEIGNQNIEISGADTNTKSISVEVVGSMSELDAPIVISPANGSLLNDVVTLVGTTEANSNLSVFAGGQFISSGESDGSGNFSIAADLSDGEYEITVAILNSDESVGSVSEPVTLKIDRTPPIIKNISLHPGNRVTAGSQVLVEVESEAGLENAQITIDKASFELKREEEPTFYSAKFTAPADGTYLLGVELTDKAGNIGQYPETTSLLVGEVISFEITATPLDGAVKLTWDEPDNYEQIANYKLLYGTSAENLNKEYTTANNGTDWTIEGLNNGTTYHFAVISLDSTGYQNGNSNIAAATPAATLIATGCDGGASLKWITSDNPMVENYRLDYGITSKDYVESRILPDGVSRDEWIVRDLINGVEYFFTLHGTDSFGAVVEDISGEVSATPQFGVTCDIEEPITLNQRKDADGNTILFWNAVPGAQSYLVYSGEEPNTFDLPTVEVFTNSYRPTNLKPNTDYYYAVRAVYANSRQAVHLSNMTKVEVGPKEILIVSVLISMVVAFWIRRKRLAQN